jgi:hypothetical protein
LWASVLDFMLGLMRLKESKRAMEMRRVREKLKRKKKDLERMRTETKTEDPLTQRLSLDGNSVSESATKKEDPESQT